MSSRFLGSSLNEEAKLCLWGAPYDGTSSHRAGARFAPERIRFCSHWLESYSPYQRTDLKDVDFFDYRDIELSFGSPEKVFDEIYGFSKSIWKKGKHSLALGGEHSITFPVVKAALENYPDLNLIHFDAHCDMRPEYGGQRLSHASVIRRVLEILPEENYFGVGIRSGEKEEYGFAQNLSHFFPFNLRQISEVVKIIPSGKPVYITLDLDILDPSFFPGTGAPEPMGVSVAELHQALCMLKGKRLIGADIVELSPPYDPSAVSSIVAAFFTREVLLLMADSLTSS